METEKEVRACGEDSEAKAPDSDRGEHEDGDVKGNTRVAQADRRRTETTARWG